MNEMAIKRRYLSKNAEVVHLHVCILGGYVHSSVLSRSKDKIACLRGGKMPSSANEATINSPNRAKSIQAAMYGTRLKRLIVDEHDVEIERTFLWTDSTTVLQWLHGADKKQPVFVTNRVAEILDGSTIDQWRHVEGTLNSADIGTRGKSVLKLEKSEWFTGPAWLREKEDAWPQTSPQLFLSKNRRHRTIL